ncbi:sphingosine-1-phosphate lyase [Myxozyma melibiosi]|uniref:sphinganine-1-phosphate aldolase n=1 Tax=Myxozyma melibiosi TaxID=54550 RepID=A0ABR1F375_9ASCO
MSLSLERTASLIVSHSRLLLDAIASSPAFSLSRNLVFAYALCSLSATAYRELWARGPLGIFSDLYRSASKLFFRYLLRAPGIRDKVDAEVSKVLVSMEQQMVPRGPDITYYRELPQHGWSEEQIIAEMQHLSLMQHSAWEAGKVSGAVYHGGKELIDLQTQAYGMFSVANQLHPDVFPDVRKMEAEVVTMVLNLFNAPQHSGVGTTTSGGTESLLLACLSAKMKAYHERHVTQPEIIAPITVHAGFDKAAYYFGIKLRHAPMDPVTYKVNLKAVRRMINSNTVLIAGSAPNFPHGIIDDIEGLSKLALRYKIPLHVDACLGSFVVPYLERVYREIDPTVNVPVVDFRLPGVTSISCDTHKYGFAPKGSSIIMYRDSSYRRHQYFLATDWSGGVYASPTLAGSRPGALIAGCWATLMKMGDDGYYSSAKSIVEAARLIRSSIAADIPQLTVLGDPISSVVAFTSSTLNIYEVADSMVAKGWHLSALQNPAALHIACTKLTTESCVMLVRDLKDSVAQIELAHGAESESDIKKKQGDTAMLYGVAGSVSTNGVVDEMVYGFLDNLYKA